MTNNLRAALAWLNQHFPGWQHKMDSVCPSTPMWFWGELLTDEEEK